MLFGWCLRSVETHDMEEGIQLNDQEVVVRYQENNQKHKRTYSQDLHKAQEGEDGAAVKNARTDVLGLTMHVLAIA